MVKARSWMTTLEVAEMVRLRPQTLRAWRHGKRGKRGPAWYRLGSAVRYSVDDVEAWLQDQRSDPE